MTAEVVFSGPQRDHVVRIPNTALSFRPPPEVLKAIGEPEPVIADGKASGMREVWEYDGKRSSRSQFTQDWPMTDGPSC